MGLHFGSALVHTYPKSEQVANFMHGNSATDEIQKSNHQDGKCGHLKVLGIF